MKRISTNMSSFDMRYHLRLKEWKMNNIQNKMASQSRIKNLRDDPIAAGHSTRYKSKIVRLDRYMNNINAVRGEIALAEGNIRSAMDILQRVRELGVQGANGIYTKEQTAFMAQEINALLDELITLANARSGEGNYLFSGFRSKTEPFRIHTGRVEGSGESEVVARIEYVGDIGRRLAEISENAFVEYSFPGNQAFWAEKQQIYSSIEATRYRVQQDSVIRIDGVDIELKEGDNVFAIMSKINTSDAPVKAKLDPVKSSLVLESTFAHQIWPEDVGEGRVLQDLGIISEGNNAPPLNIADSAQVFGGSIFDMIIHLRNSLYTGDTRVVGGSGIRGIDEAIGTLTADLASVGSLDARLEITGNRLAYEKPEYIRFDSEEVDLDLSEAITELKMLEYTHKAALATAARILRPTLLDFLR